MRKIFNIGEVIYHDSVGDYCEIIAKHNTNEYLCIIYELDEVETCQN